MTTEIEVTDSAVVITIKSAALRSRPHDGPIMPTSGGAVDVSPPDGRTAAAVH